MYFVYILLCNDGSFYTGSTNDLKQRFLKHQKGQGGAYTRSHPPSKILYTEKHPDKSAALHREHEIKSWSRHKKIVFLDSNKLKSSPKPG